MEFDKSRCYSALNADELHKGDKVIVADTMSELKIYVEVNAGTLEIERIEDDNCINRFTTTNMNSWRVHFPLAYLVERAENCTNCNTTCMSCIKPDKTFRCDDYEPKNKKEIDMNWNYVNEGKLPTRQEMGVSDRVVVAVKGYNVPDVGYYDYELEAWFVDGNRYPVPVYAWHYDKPPREE